MSGNNIFVCPSSGGGYPAQFGLLRLLLSAGIKPDKCIGTSGGALSIYLAAAAKWNPDEMTKIASHLHDGLVFESWYPWIINFLPNPIAGYKRGSLNNRSQNAHKFFSSYFQEVPSDVEIWTGTYNVKTSKSHFFINTNTKLPFMDINYQQFSSDIPSVVSDVDELANVVIASLSIPAMLPPVRIGDSLYCDGGVIYSSPLSVLYQILPPNSHVTYINSTDMNIYDKLSLSLESHDNLFGTIEAAVHTLTRGLCITDIALGMEAMKKMGRQTAHHIYTNLNEKVLSDLETERHKHKASFLNIYPVDTHSLRITSFNGEDVKNIMNSAHQKCNAELYLYD